MLRLSLTVFWLALSACGARELTAPSPPGSEPPPDPPVEEPGTTDPLPNLQHGVHVDSLQSATLGATKHFVVYLPPSYGEDSDRRYPVVYYLHGGWGNEDNWFEHGRGRLAATLDSLIAAGMPEMIAVGVDGDDSWFVNWVTNGDYAGCVAGKPRLEPTAPPRTEPAASYCVPQPRYEDYIARDLVQTVDRRYRTLADRGHRAIAGLSMGGYGAFVLALRRPDVWSAAVSHSGPLSWLYLAPIPFAEPRVYATHPLQLQLWWGSGWWESLSQKFGADLTGWRDRDPSTLVRELAGRRRAQIPALRFDVGWNDSGWLIAKNDAFHAELDELGIPHVFNTYGGAHNWDYWRARTPEALLWIAEQIAPS